MADEYDFFMESGSDDGEDEMPHDGGGRGPQSRRTVTAVPLHQFLRLIAGGPAGNPGTATTNEELIEALQRGGAIETDRVATAMRICARNLFVPVAYRPEALLDAPIRLEEMGFNISAPHMHATCLETLALRPGDRVLDVGTGCGVLAAAAAFLVGKSGAVTAIDIRRDALRLARRGLRALTEASSEYALSACPVALLHRDVFLPATELAPGSFDAVHVGASCPPDRLAPLVALLARGGGRMIVPVAPSDLRLITRAADGSITQRVISQVRFSELELPRDAAVALAGIRAQRKARTAAPPPPVSLVQDLESMPSLSPRFSARSAGSVDKPPGALDNTPSPKAACTDRTQSTADGPNKTPCSPQAVWDGPSSSGSVGGWSRRLSSFLGSCSGAGPRSDAAAPPGSEGRASSSNGTASEEAAAAKPDLDHWWDDLGKPDVTLSGADYEFHVHSEVLRQRCEYFGSRWTSGMSDATVDRIVVPEDFDREAVETLIHWMYHDKLPQALHSQQAMLGALLIGQYYGVRGLVHGCEVALAGTLTQKNADESELAGTAAAMLGFAVDNGLDHLGAVALDYVIHHHTSAAATPAYAHLGREPLALIAAEACALHANTLQTLERIGQPEEELPEPSW